jgi:hypothetical protein
MHLSCLIIILSQSSSHPVRYSICPPALNAYPSRSNRRQNPHVQYAQMHTKNPHMTFPPPFSQADSSPSHQTPAQSSSSSNSTSSGSTAHKINGPPYSSSKSISSSCKSQLEKALPRDYQDLTHRRIPPPPQDDAAPGQHDALVRPQVIVVDKREVLLEVLHEGDALPAGDAGLGGERVEVAVGVEEVVEVFAVA